MTEQKIPACYDVIIIGAGLAGLYCSLCLSPKLNVLTVSKAGALLNNSSLAQGGVAAVMDSLDDDFKLHVKDTLIAGGYGNDVRQVERLVEHGPEDIQALINFGVRFDHTPDGKIDLTLEGGHSRRRIAHCKDSTGAEIVEVLLARVNERKNITLLHDTAVLTVTKISDYFRLTLIHDNVRLYYTTKRVVIATGGIGGLYKYTTNSPIATGDGIRFAYELGARIKNLSRIQFHPTAFAGAGKRTALSDYNDDIVPGAALAENTRRFLISEAVRGEGAYLLNCNRERFMPRYEPQRKELAPRDVVSNCIIEEQKRTGSDEFYIDITHVSAVTVRERFPMIYSRLLEHGYDLTREPVPIYPCQHYLMGGIDVDERGRTTVAGLYAAGECAHTGVHGNNRLASNSLLEALVFSRFIADDINSKNKAEPLTVEVNKTEIALPVYEYDTALCRQIREIMTESFFVVPDLDKSRAGLTRINTILRREELNSEIRSLATAAKIILEEITDFAQLAG